MAHFLNVEEVKDETKMLVSGFTRNCQSSFDTTNPYYNIPELVVRIIIAYFAEVEYFESRSIKLSLSVDQRKIEKIAVGGYHSAYGHVIIDGNTDKSIHR